MNFEAIIIAAVVLGIIGLAIGLILGTAGKLLYVEVDEREEKVRECLPGNNCGGCGYAGCDALAKAISQNLASVNACLVGGNDVAEKIANIMGVTAGQLDRKVAYIKCSGTCDKAINKYNYYGIQDCRSAVHVPGTGAKACSSGCLGLGSCASVCSQDAIHIIDGVAVVDKDACLGCGSCVKACPKNLVELVPVKAQYHVVCASTDKGKDVKAVCQSGCIGCRMCTRVCESGAITVDNNIAHIDYSLCTGCGKCAKKCPVKVIH